jgi:hypothetical protein
MAFSEALRLVIDADTRGAVSGIQKVGATTERELGRSQKSMDKWGRGLTTAGAGMIALGGAALFGLGKAAMASEEANLAVVKLENTLTNMPALAGENSKSFIDLAQSIQDKTAADADAIVEAEALLGTFQLTGDEIRKITPLVVDYSRKFGIDMTGAAIQVGKALDGNVGALKRNGVSIDEVMFKTDRYGAVQKALSEQVGGFAAAEGKTFAGSLERLKNQLGDVVEGVGVGAVDAFSSLFGIVEFGTDKLNDLSPAAQSAIGKVATFGSVALVAAGGMSFAVGQAIKMRQNFAALGDAVAAARLKMASLSLAAGPLGIGAALLAAGTGFALYLKQQKHAEIAAAAEAFAKLRDVTTESAAATLQLNDAVRVSKTDFTASRSAADEFAATGEVTSDVMRDLNKHWDEIIDKAPQFAQGFIDNAAAIGVGKDQLAEWRGELDNKIATDQEAVAATDEYNAAVQGTTEATEDATSALQEYSDTLAALTDPVFAAMDAITGVRDAQVGLRDASLGLRDAEAQVMVATAELNEALESGDQDAIAEKTRGLEDAQRGLEDAQRGLADAQWGTVQSAAEADSAMAGLKDAVDAGDVSVDLFKDTLKTWVAQGFLTQGQADKAAKSVGGLASQAENADKKRVDIPVTTPGSKASAGQLDIIRDKAFQIPLSRRVALNANDRASGIIDFVRRNLRNLDGNSATVTIRQNTIFTETLRRFGALGGTRQHGGPVTAGRAYLVGEQRPEVFVPNENGRILPSVQSLGHWTGGGGGGTTVNNYYSVNVPNYVGNRGELVAAINSELDRGARLGKNGRSR